MKAVNYVEFAASECVSCHNVETSCNNCHAYVGVKAVVVRVDSAFVPGQDWFRRIINAGKGKGGPIDE
jgi:hypothetical protein